MLIRHLLVPALLALVASPALAADTLVIDKSHSEAGFQVRHLVSKVSGRFGEFSGTVAMDPANPGASSVVFTIEAASIDTDNADRDKHLRSPDFFDVANHPAITFRSERFMASHMILERIRPEAPTREPLITSPLFPSTKPVAQAARPE